MFSVVEPVPCLDARNGCEPDFQLFKQKFVAECSDFEDHSCVLQAWCQNTTTTPRIDIDNLLTKEAEKAKCLKQGEVCCHQDDIKPPMPIQNCGFHNPDGLAYARVKGLSSQEGEWTHACLMYHMVKGSPEYFAGATLISPGVLVTAAHKAE